MVSGHHEPAFTVASFATTTTSRPCTTPSPVTTPAPGAWPSYSSYATSRPISTKGAPASQSLDDALARGQLPLLVLARGPVASAALAQPRLERTHLVGQYAQAAGRARGAGRVRPGRGGRGHAPASLASRDSAASRSENQRLM